MHFLRLFRIILGAPVPYSVFLGRTQQDLTHARKILGVHGVHTYLSLSGAPDQLAFPVIAHVDCNEF